MVWTIASGPGAVLSIVKPFFLKIQEVGARDDAAPNKKLPRRFCEDVNNESPPEHFWIPDWGHWRKKLMQNEKPKNS